MSNQDEETWAQQGPEASVARHKREKGTDPLEQVLQGVVSEGDPEAIYLKLVEAGKHVVSNSNWLLGRLAKKVDESYVDDTLRDYARRIELPLSTIRNALTVARAWPEDWHEHVSFGAAKVLAGQEDRFALVQAEPGMTVARAQQIVNERRALAAGQPAPGPGDDEPAGGMVRVIQRTLSEQIREIDPAHAAQVADILDRAANRLRRRAKEIE